MINKVIILCVAFLVIIGVKTPPNELKSQPSVVNNRQNAQITKNNKEALVTGVTGIKQKISSLETKLADRDAFIAQLKQQLIDRDGIIKTVQKKVEVLEDRVDANKKEILINRKNIVKIAAETKLLNIDSIAPVLYDSLVWVSKKDTLLKIDTVIQYKKWYFGKIKYKPLHKTK